MDASIERNTVNPAFMAFKAILIGVPLGGLCVGAALIVMGMGHGWGAPITFGWLSLLFFPLAIFRWRVGMISWLDDIATTLIIVLILLAVAVIIGPFIGGGLPIGAIHMQGWLLILSIFGIYIGLHMLFNRIQLSRLWGDIVLLCIALLCNIAIYRDATGDAAFGFRGNAFEILWLAIWGIWQAIVLIATVRHLRERRDGTEVPI
jgi:hypothetical protein